MSAINFTMFIDKVEDGTKNQTIRKLSRGGAMVRAGANLQLYTGLRTKECRKLREVVCKSVTPIILMEGCALPHGNVALTGVYLEEFAHADGFACYADMWEFFKVRANQAVEFHGVLIKW